MPTIPIVTLLTDIGATVSRSEARRLISQGAVRVDGDPINDLLAGLDAQEGTEVSVGRRTTLRLEGGQWVKSKSP